MRSVAAVMEHSPATGPNVDRVPDFPGAHSQGELLDRLCSNLEKVIEMRLEDGES